VQADLSGRGDADYIGSPGYPRELLENDAISSNLIVEDNQVQVEKSMAAPHLSHLWGLSNSSEKININPLLEQTQHVVLVPGGANFSQD
jgi:hypothetical protein